jgi:hypothetical protein
MAAVLPSTLSAFLQPGRAAGPARFGPAKAGGLMVFWGNYKVGRGNFKVWGGDLGGGVAAIRGASIGRVSIIRYDYPLFIIRM